MTLARIRKLKRQTERLAMQQLRKQAGVNEASLNDELVVYIKQRIGIPLTRMEGLVRILSVRTSETDESFPALERALERAFRRILSGNDRLQHLVELSRCERNEELEGLLLPILADLKARSAVLRDDTAPSRDGEFRLIEGGASKP